METKKCAGFLTDGVSKCPYGAKQGEYCNIHYKKYNTESEVKVGTPEYENLLIVKFPEISKEWDYEKNVGINIKAISYSSHMEVWWLCSKSKHSFKASVNNRTRKTSKTGCKTCGDDSLRVHDKKLLEEQRNKKIVRNDTETGDDTEDFIKELLEKTKIFKNVTKIGNLGGSADISVTNMDDSVNYIQIKTLTKNNNVKNEEVYYITNESKYTDDMLIVMINRERNRFGLDFFKNIKNVKRLSLVFNAKKSKYKEIMFTDIEKFTTKLVKLIPLSSKNNSFNKNITKEIEMLKRFELFCEEKGILYSRNTTNSNTIDGFINGFAFQAKFRSLNSANEKTYNIDSFKSSGILNGKSVKRYYDVGDFDFFIIEVGGTEEEVDKYKGNFCIIPSSAILKQNIFKTDEIKGKKSFYICPPDYERPHWSKEFWNNTTNIPAPSV